MSKKFLPYFLIIIFLILGIGFYFYQITNQPQNEIKIVPPVSIAPSIIGTSTPEVKSTILESNKLAWPLTDAPTRITKKPFGLKVSPNDSPTIPEHFNGYHTGVDFEIFSQEATSTVPVLAVCSGQLLMKKWATGYGGVAVQQCKLVDQVVTVIYGHLNINSVKHTVGQKINAGQEIGILGQGHSQETDGERKHLHLGIHKGPTINILGYVPKSSQLVDWLNAAQYLTN